MKCNLIVSINEVTVRDYTLIEDEGLQALASSRAGVSLTYEEDEEKANKHVIVIKAITFDLLLQFLSFIELPVNVIM